MSTENAQKFASMNIPPLSTQSSLLVAFAIAFLVLSAVVYLSTRKSSKGKSVVLLVGPSDAGKTVILTKLIYDQSLPTHTSIQVNSSVLPSEKSTQPLYLVDVPGHPRLRDQFKDHVQNAKAIAFVVDSSTISRNGPAVAEHLHHILISIVSLPPTSSLPPLLILAHKADLISLPSSASSSDRPSLAITRVRTVLERELEKRRASQTGGVAVEGLGAEDESGELGGLECRSSGTFRFSEWEGGEVSFIGTFVRVGEISEKSNEKSEDGLSSFREVLEGLQ